MQSGRVITPVRVCNAIEDIHGKLAFELMKALKGQLRQLYRAQSPAAEIPRSSRSAVRRPRECKEEEKSSNKRSAVGANSSALPAHIPDVCGLAPIRRPSSAVFTEKNVDQVRSCAGMVVDGEFGVSETALYSSSSGRTSVTDESARRIMRHRFTDIKYVRGHQLTYCGSSIIRGTINLYIVALYH
jgi:hypothetical protein